MWEIRGTTCLIGFTRPYIGVIIHWIRSCICRIRNGKLSHTQNSLKFQFLINVSHLLSSLAFSSSTQPWPRNTKFSHSSLSRYTMCMSQNHVQHTLNIAYTKYCIHSMIDYLPLPASLSSLEGPWCTQFCTLPPLQVNQWIESSLLSRLLSDLPPAGELPADCPPADRPLPDQLLPDQPPPDQPPADQPCADRPPPDRPPLKFLPPDLPCPRSPPILIDRDHHVHLQTHSVTATNGMSWLGRLQSWTASLSSLDLGLQVHLQIHSITASQVTQSWPPNLLYYGLTIYHCIHLILAAKYIW